MISLKPPEIRKLYKMHKSPCFNEHSTFIKEDMFKSALSPTKLSGQSPVTFKSIVGIDKSIIKVGNEKLRLPAKRDKKTSLKKMDDVEEIKSMMDS
jgi:hypothetical protein